MLEHLNAEPIEPRRVVVLGSGGFVGGATVSRLEACGISVLGLSRTDVDLLSMDADDVLCEKLRPDDTLVVVAALAPCKTNQMLVENLCMMDRVCMALQRAPVGHVVYISSDAVYRDALVPLTEESCAEPGSLHGAMHLAREVMLKGACEARLAILRPSLLYGATDPHNGYGPNRFRRLAAKHKTISLFGEGEERRDHVFIDDLAEIVRLTVVHKSTGVLNVATGSTASFREIAEMVASLFDPPAAIQGTQRQGPMPHGGYRPFDIDVCRNVYPEFRYTTLAEGLAKVHRDAAAQR